MNASLVPSSGYAEGGKAFYAGDLILRVLFDETRRKKDARELNYLRKKAAEHGSSRGQRLLARCYDLGIGVRKNDVIFLLCS